MVIFISAGAFRVLRVPYKNKNIWLCSRRSFLLEKKFSFGKKRGPCCQNQKKKKKKKTFHQKAFIRTKSKKNFFSPYFLLKTTFKSNKRLQSQFSSQEQIKTVNTLWRENQYCINIYFLLLSLFVYYFI